MCISILFVFDAFFSTTGSSDESELERAEPNRKPRREKKPADFELRLSFSAVGATGFRCSEPYRT